MSSTVAITIITVALSLLSFFLIITSNISYLIAEIRSRVELEAFLDKSLDTESSQRMAKAILAIEGVDSVYFISKAQAAKALKAAMGEEDIFDLVESNPLPASFKIKLNEDYRTTGNVADVAKQVELIDGIDEVNYQKELLRALDERIQTYHEIAFGLGIFAALAAIFLVSNTIKLSIYAKRDLIKTMKLVGATNAFVASPFLIEGMLQGLIGSALACSVSYFIVSTAKKYIIESLQITYDVYGTILLMGIALGLLGSFVSIRFFLKGKISDM